MTCQQHLDTHTARTTHLGATSWHHFPCCQHTEQLCFLGKTSPQGQRWTTRPISARLSTDFCLQQVLQVQGCCCLQPGPAATTGDQNPSEHSTAPRDNKVTVPVPRAGSYHHHYYNLVRGAAILNRHCLHTNTLHSSGLRALNISAGEQKKLQSSHLLPRLRALLKSHRGPFVVGVKEIGLM